ncbi:MAG: AbrB/MazE/SpoVT family DNA-binding domain-containing protein [Terracidiphilus sp.]
MPTATVTSKGQITIPAQVRISLGLDTGDKVDFVEIEKGQFILKPRTASIRDLEGCVPKLNYVPTIEEMKEAVLEAAEENYRASVGDSSSNESEGEAA